MTQHEFSHLMESISGLSPDQLRQLRRELDDKLATATPPESSPLTPDQLRDQEVQRQLFAAGLLSEIKPPVRDLAEYRNRRAVPIQGEPLSVTVIQDRR
jgi:hypothetical protein